MRYQHEYTAEEIEAAADNGTILLDNSRADADKCGAWVIYERAYPNGANTAYPERHQRSDAALISHFDHERNCHVYWISFGAKYPAKYRLRKAAIKVVFSNSETIPSSEPVIESLREEVESGRRRIAATLAKRAGESLSAFDLKAEARESESDGAMNLALGELIDEGIVEVEGAQLTLNHDIDPATPTGGLPTLLSNPEGTS